MILKYRRVDLDQI